MYRPASSMMIFAALLFTTALYSQENQNGSDTLRKGALKIFLDCRTCDMNYTREEIPYVNYVRDVKEAEVYILVTTQNSGSGGNMYTYTFTGQFRFRGMNDTLTFSSNPDMTSTQIREKRTELLKMGLMRYVAKTPLAGEIEIRHNQKLQSEEVVDKWNNWVFEIQTSPRFNAEASNSRIFFRNSLNITRITSDLKFELELEGDNSKQKFVYDDGEEIIYRRKDESLDILLVKSIGEHWSAGSRMMMSTATNPNYDLNFEFMPAVEYDIFPYSIATHKQLRINYSAGYQYSNYIDTTLLNKLNDNLLKQELRIAYQVQEKWGSINISLTGSNYFHDLSKNRVELNGFVRLRIVKGLSLSVNGEAAYINDQLNLRKGELTEAERLLRLKEQATNYSIGGSISITYTFGSIYNNVVNPRFGSGGGGGGGMYGFY
ncbi:MAG TPA: hypothetical protein P5257_05015 [Bacteroidales bacterium]|nr:hypothetical protein [Bacteroidales bacterium]HRR94181.1 hypothetical protein [Bacteroidales bacterium]HRT89462.1 hypothetical protein [Bacteroidales bacterium]